MFSVGEIVIDNSTKVTEKNLEDLLKNHCSSQDVEKFKKNNELDCGFTLGDVRFRANFFRSLHGISAVLRKVETKVLSMEPTPVQVTAFPKVFPITIVKKRVKTKIANPRPKLFINPDSI